MKTHILIYIIAGGLILASACTDLNETVYDTLPEDEFGSSIEEISAIVAPAYLSLRNLSSYDQAWGWADISADIMIAPTRVGGDWWDGGQYMVQTMHSWDARSLAIWPLWNGAMSAIATINKIIASLLTNPQLEVELRERTMAELRGLRAFWYYQLIDYFGNVPLVTNYEDKTLPETRQRAQIYQFIVTELLEVIPHLRADVTDESYGKFTKGAAFTLLAKMYLNAQEWTGTANWQGAISACDSVMLCDYEIEPVWKTNFQVHNETSREIILPICYTNADAWGNVLHLYTLGYTDPVALGFAGEPWNGVCALPDFVNSFLDDDIRKRGSFLYGELRDPSSGELIVDHTIDMTIIPGSETDYPNGWGEVSMAAGARINKWEFEKGMMNTSLENDLIIFRLADIYLMKAEALTRLGADNAEATRLVNIIRERAFGSDSHNYTAVSLADIYSERRFELAFEFCGRQDMIRFGTFLLPRMFKPTTTESYRKLLPIPFDAWQANNKLVQNPGYPAF